MGEPPGLRPAYDRGFMNTPPLIHPPGEGFLSLDRDRAGVVP